MTDLNLALIGLAISTLSFIVGGGALGKYLSKAHRALVLTDFDQRYATKEQMADLRDDLNQWQIRVQQDIVAPLAEQAKATRELAISVALQSQALDHFGTDLRSVSDEVRALRQSQHRAL